MKEARIQPYLSANYGYDGFLETFDVSFNHGDISFEILEMTPEEIRLLAQHLLEQLNLLMEFNKDIKRKDSNV